MFDKLKEIIIGFDVLLKLGFVFICNFCFYYLF